MRCYPPARKNKLCSPWIGPYKIVRAPMEWVVGIQVDADARIVYVHMDDLKRCATPDPEPSWPDTARGTSIVVSTRAPSTFALTDTARSQKQPSNTSQQPRSSAHHTDSISSGDTDVRAPDTAYTYENIVKLDTVPDSIVKTDTVPISTWDLQDAKCILSMKSDCSIDVKGFRFFTMEILFYALQLLSLGDRKFIRQLAKYSRMDYVRKCVNTRFELASTILQDKWLDEQFQTWTVYYQTPYSSKHYWIQQAHLYVTPKNQCTRQRLRQHGKCVYNESCSVGRHGSPSPRVSHVARRLPDWPRGCCIMTWNFSCRAAMATSPCSDKVHCRRVTIRSIFTRSGRINCTIDN